MLNVEIINCFMDTVAMLFGLSEEHGTAMTALLTLSHKSSRGLFVNTVMWRDHMNKQYGWTTDKPTTRILKDLENNKLIVRSDRYHYQLNEVYFGNDWWYLISHLSLEMEYAEGKRTITVHREYQKPNWDNMEDINNEE